MFTAHIPAKRILDSGTVRVFFFGEEPGKIFPKGEEPGPENREISDFFLRRGEKEFGELFAGYGSAAGLVSPAACFLAAAEKFGAWDSGYVPDLTGNRVFLSFGVITVPETAVKAAEFCRREHAEITLSCAFSSVRLSYKMSYGCNPAFRCSFAGGTSLRITEEGITFPYGSSDLVITLGHCPKIDASGKFFDATVADMFRSEDGSAARIVWESVAAAFAEKNPFWNAVICDIRHSFCWSPVKIAAADACTSAFDYAMLRGLKYVPVHSENLTPGDISFLAGAERIVRKEDMHLLAGYRPSECRKSPDGTVSGYRIGRGKTDAAEAVAEYIWDACGASAYEKAHGIGRGRFFSFGGGAHTSFGILTNALKAAAEAGTKIAVDGIKNCGSDSPENVLCGICTSAAMGYTKIRRVSVPEDSAFRTAVLPEKYVRITDGKMLAEAEASLIMSDSEAEYAAENIAAEKAAYYRTPEQAVIIVEIRCRGSARYFVYRGYYSSGQRIGRAEEQAISSALSKCVPAEKSARSSAVCTETKKQKRERREKMKLYMRKRRAAEKTAAAAASAEEAETLSDSGADLCGI